MFWKNEFIWGLFEILAADGGHGSIVMLCYDAFLTRTISFWAAGAKDCASAKCGQHAGCKRVREGNWICVCPNDLKIPQPDGSCSRSVGNNNIHQLCALFFQNSYLCNYYTLPYCIRTHKRFWSIHNSLE